MDVRPPASECFLSNEELEFPIIKFFSPSFTSGKATSSGTFLHTLYISSYALGLGTPNIILVSSSFFCFKITGFVATFVALLFFLVAMFFVFKKLDEFLASKRVYHILDKKSNKNITLEKSQIMVYYLHDFFG